MSHGTLTPEQAAALKVAHEKHLLLGFLTRLSRRQRRSGVLADVRYFDALTKDVDANRVPSVEDNRKLREWWEYLETRERELRPEAIARTKLRGASSSLWQAGSALDLTDAEIDAKAPRVAAFVAEKIAVRKPSIEPLVEAVASEAQAGGATWETIG